MKLRLVFLGMAVALLACNGMTNGPISASGTIEAVEVTVNAKVGGTIVQLAVDEGKEVKKGDLLAQVDTVTLDIRRRQAVANTEAAQAQHLLLKRGFRQEDIRQADASYSKSLMDFRRVSEIYSGGSATPKQLDDAWIQFALAQANLEKLYAGYLPEEKEAARAKAELAQAQADEIGKMISDSRIVSPINGTVTQKSIEEGDDVLPNSQAFRITRLDSVHLMIYVTEVELARVRLGQEANVFIDAYPKRAFKGKVTYISPVAEFTPKNVQTKDDRTKLVFGVKIEIPNPERILKPGMPADAALVEGK